MSEAPTTLLLDLGGVVVDVDLAAGQDELRRRTDCPAGEYDRIFGDSGIKAQMELGRLDGIGGLEAALALLGRGYRDDVEAALNAVLRVRPAVVAHLNALADRGIEIAVLSNTDPIHGAWMRAHTGLRPARWYFSYDLGLCKPDPAIFRRVLADLGRDPWDAALLDDREDNLAAAASLGIAGVRFTTFDDARAGLAALGL